MLDISILKQVETPSADLTLDDFIMAYRAFLIKHHGRFPTHAFVERQNHDALYKALVPLSGMPYVTQPNEPRGEIYIQGVKIRVGDVYPEKVLFAL